MHVIKCIPNQIQYWTFGIWGVKTDSEEYCHIGCRGNDNSSLPQCPERKCLIIWRDQCNATTLPASGRAEGISHNFIKVSCNWNQIFIALKHGRSTKHYKRVSMAAIHVSSWGPKTFYLYYMYYLYYSWKNHPRKKDIYIDLPQIFSIIAQRPGGLGIKWEDVILLMGSNWKTCNLYHIPTS